MSNELKRTSLINLKSYLARLGAFGLAAASLGTVGCSNNGKKVTVDVPPSIEITNTPDIAELTTFTTDPTNTPKSTSTSTVAPTNTPEPTSTPTPIPTSTPTPTANPYPNADWYAYLNNKDFKIDRIQDYENVRNILNIPANMAVDYVNRAYEIEKTNFFEDYSIFDICKILEIIHEGDITRDFVRLDNAFSDGFNPLALNYLDNLLEGKPTSKEDLNKIEALKYLDTKNSKLDIFFTKLAEIVKGILKNPNDDNLKQTLFNFTNVFAHRINGSNNYNEYNTDDEIFNESAEIPNIVYHYLAYKLVLKNCLTFLNTSATITTEYDLFDYLQAIAEQKETLAERMALLEKLLIEKGYSDIAKEITRIKALDWLDDFLLTYYSAWNSEMCGSYSTPVLGGGN